MYTVRQSGLYALAMAMVTNIVEARPLDWSSSAREKRYYNSLRTLFSHHWLKYNNGNEGKALSIVDLVSLIVLRRAAYGGDKYQLYIDDHGYISPANVADKTAKNVLLRRDNSRWEACCYFKVATDFTISPFQTLPFEPSLELSSPISKALDQDEDYITQTAAQTLDSTISKPATSTPVDSAKNTLVNALGILSSDIKELTLAIEKRSESEKSLCTAVEKLTASLKKVTQV
ncbi:hypothetical protein KCU83_g510, partial [Aureobasidium melanogenum]